jgi:hypothetical protein
MSAALLLLLLAAPQDAPDTLVVCPAAFREALQPWVEFRARQGHVLTLVSNTQPAEAIRRQIRDAAKQGRLQYVVLVGNARPGCERDPALRARSVPVHYEKAKVNIQWGSEPYIATDNWYADLNDDQVPELAIGRLPADSPAELRQMVAKTLAYERSTDFGPWRRQLNFVAGMGGFGALADTVLESAARHVLTQNIPAGYRVSMTYGSWRSPYCPDPRLFHATTLERLNEGAWFWVYIGHTPHPAALNRLRMPDGDYHILDIHDVPKLNCAHAGPIALFLCCYSGAIDATTDCLAKQMLRQPGGPVAVVAGSRVTMPYGMTVLATGLLDEVFRKRCPTVGEAMLHAKQAMLKEPAAGDQQRAMVDAIAAAVSPAARQMAEERTEHVQMFNLIGDPLLRLRYGEEIKVEVAKTAAPGEVLTVAGSTPVEGRGTVELAVRRGRLSFKPPLRREYSQTAAALAEFQEVYCRANDQRLVSVPVQIAGGRFEVSLDVPADAEGACQVCVFVEGRDAFALGSADVKIEGKQEAATRAAAIPLRPNRKR